jgi:imidazolonepropionase-like amidohydrolase
MNIKIKNVALFDGVIEYIERTSIIFNEKGILAIGDECTGFEADEIIDGTGFTTMPGLIDSHVHLGMDGLANPTLQIAKDNEAKAALSSYRNSLIQLQAGVTTVRSLGAKYNTDISLRNSINEGVLEGPRIIASGSPIVMTGGHGYFMGIEVDGVEEVRKATRTQLKAGADVIKLMATGGVMTEGVEPGSPQLTEEEMRVACEEAKKAGKITASHAQGNLGIKNAIRAGITSIEHGFYIDEETIELMLQYGTYLVATLAAPYHIVKQGLEAGIPKYAVDKATVSMEAHIESFQKACKAGVKIAAGTDAGTPFNKHGDFVTELRLMVETGMSNKEALSSATFVAAQLLNLDQTLGSLAIGKVADIIMVQGNPLENIENARKVVKVFKQGKCVVDKVESRKPFQ